MKKIVLAGFCAIIMSGCATSQKMPEQHYKGFSEFIGYLHKCFEAEYIEPKMFAETKNSFSYVLSTWSYDQYKLESMISSEYSKAYANKKNCRQLEAQAYQMNSKAAQHSSTVKANAQANQQAWDNLTRDIYRNKPIYCNTIGTMTTCF
ncbi:hypothetical protein P3672_17685 [Vibrio parahaemolyticus]|nr:hypothetical protein [Vibrio parahaemolyticus]